MKSALSIIEDFYAARASGDLDAVSAFIAEDVRWIEPDVQDHMGELIGRDAVIDMMTRALAKTAGTFSLAVTEGVEVEGHCSVVISWSAEKGDTLIEGQELATYSVVDGKITFAQFLPANIRNDDVFWA